VGDRRVVFKSKVNKLAVAARAGSLSASLDAAYFATGQAMIYFDLLSEEEQDELIDVRMNLSGLTQRADILLSKVTKP
jgi:hypothetical protein